MKKKWKANSIDIDKLPIIIEELMKKIKVGDDSIERLRCVYKIDNLNIIQCLTPYDFIDNLETKPNIVKFYLYQLIDS